ncbi:MAG TPA: DUF3341 domain-containing protein [Stellaceae bacterium]|nr:DUF3341 domain-containing protein [Stellaceae bacterium]
MSPEPYGVVAAFVSEEELVAAVHRLRLLGLEIETYTPYPVPAVERLLNLPPSPLPIIIFAAAMIGAGGGFLLQYWGMALAYPINVGGRPLNSWPAFMTSTFEIGILLAFVIGFAAYLFMARLVVTLHHPIFNAPGFERASQDEFLVCVRGRRRAEIAVLLGPLRPRRLAEVPA